MLDIFEEPAIIDEWKKDCLKCFIYFTKNNKYFRKNILLTLQKKIISNIKKYGNCFGIYIFRKPSLIISDRNFTNCKFYKIRELKNVPIGLIIS